jgi:prepilin-type N-terminal cleavage/methylation domain-containing protein
MRRTSSDARWGRLQPLDAAMTYRTRSAFTMIELLVVISIISVLAAMVLVGAGALGIGSKREKTRTILAAVRKGIELTIANKGGSISPVEHPLAGSRAGVTGSRFLFKRYTQPTGMGTSMPAAGLTLDTSSIALAGLNSTLQMPNGTDPTGQLMLPSDLYADPKSYLLYGVKREFIGVLGALQKRVTKYILLPKPLQGQTSLSAALYPSLTTSALPQYTIPTDLLDMDTTFGHPSANKQAIDYVFGSSNVQTELAGLNAMYLADPTTYANSSGAGGVLNSKSNAFRYAVNWSAVSTDTGPDLVLAYTDGHVVPNWQPGCLSMAGGTPTINDSDPGGGGWSITAPGGGSWLHYRLPGLAIYDAWKVEVLYTISAQGGVRLMSAGADGVFQFNPGVNHILDSTDPEMGPSGDDQDGSKDNLVERVEEQQ